MNGKEIDNMMKNLNSVSLCDWYLSVATHVPKIEAMLHVVAKDAPWVHLLTSRALEVHMQARTQPSNPDIDHWRTRCC